MQADFNQEVSPQAAAALIAHLRQHPENARRSAKDLARDFGLSEAFVGSVLDGLRPPESEPANARRTRISFSFLFRAWVSFVQLFDRMTARPNTFIVATTALCLVVSVGATLLPGADKLQVSGIGITLDDAIVGVAILATFALHMACYFHRRMARYALYGAVFVWVVSALLAMVGIWLAAGGQEESNRFMAVMGAGIGMFFVSLIYAGAGSLMAVGGGWLSMKLREREQDQMSRQELLERYFELQSRLNTGGATTTERMPWSDFAAVLRFQRHPFSWSFALGAMLSATQVLLIGSLGVNVSESLQELTLLGAMSLVFGVAISVANFLAYVAVGFFAGQVPRALVCSLLYSLGAALPMLIPIGDYGPAYLFSTRRMIGLPLMSVFYAVVSCIAAVGAIVQNRALREKSLQCNDPASIVAEMLRIQWRLADHVSNVCVMVVDAAKSSLMKAEADPLAVEYSFREYQDWLETIGRQFGGRVHSTAGDGAVISFETCEDALEAARRIQKDLPRFNSEENRLKSPFRLRIGLHVGQIAGDIDEVQFTEVIDIAAHVQDVAPISGIAITDDVAASLPQTQSIPLAVEVDGHKVFLVMQPTP
jgi:class 3 adenylate cyclase